MMVLFIVLEAVGLTGMLKTLENRFRMAIFGRVGM
jgi:hypothetical protein